MGEVIELDDYRPHVSGEAACLLCGHMWVAVAPVGTVVLECPGCHSMAGRFLYPVEE